MYSKNLSIEHPDGKRRQKSSTWPRAATPFAAKLREKRVLKILGQAGNTDSALSEYAEWNASENTNGRPAASGRGRGRPLSLVKQGIKTLGTKLNSV